VSVNCISIVGVLDVVAVGMVVFVLFIIARPKVGGDRFLCCCIRFVPLGLEVVALALERAAVHGVG
jgi:hypothetical protein